MSATTTDAVRPSPEEGAERPSIAARLVLALLWLYQRTTVARMPRCRFHPTCSQYAVDSVRVHGALRGTAHAIARIGRCHPWNPGGVDPVKPPQPRKSDS